MRGARLAAAAALLAFACCFRAAAAAAPIRGLQPELADRYEPKAGMFECLDGSMRIDFSRVNDDYCDCSDGSDEPGTSACPNGFFYCRNRGHEPKVMSTAFVDDGVCDCCDGTDEPRGCANTCIAKNAKVREGLQQQVDSYKSALAKRKEYAQKGSEHRKEMRERLSSIDQDIDGAEEEVKRLQGERAKLEATSEDRKAARLVKKQLEAAERAEQQRKEQEAAAAAEAEAAAAAAAAAAAKGAEAGGAGAEGSAAAEEHAAAASQEADVAQKEETAEERGRRIAAQWTHDPEAAGAAEAEAPADDIAAAVEVTEEQSEGATQATPEVEESEDPELDEVDKKSKEAAERVRALHEEKKMLHRQIRYDFSADDAWMALISHCADATMPQYTYRLCLFEGATQIDNGARHKTNLGVWQGFRNGYTEGVFDKGDPCSGAPPRSMTVRFVCGLEEAAYEASEPSACAYAATMATPAACKEDDLRTLEDRLQQLEQEERRLAQEIAEEEEARRRLEGAAGGAGEAAVHEEL